MWHSWPHGPRPSTASTDDDMSPSSDIQPLQPANDTRRLNTPQCPALDIRPPRLTTTLHLPRPAPSPSPRLVLQPGCRERTRVLICLLFEQSPQFLFLPVPSFRALAQVRPSPFVLTGVRTARSLSPHNPISTSSGRRPTDPMSRART